MRTVLVFEDNQAQRVAIAHLLSAAGLNIVEARDGLEALTKVHEHLPDVVLADIISPKMNGYQLCHALKTHPNTCHIPVIFCTVKPPEEDLSQTPDSGDAYITKPFQPPELVETIMAELLRQGKSCFHPTEADDWTEVGLMWLEDFQNHQWALQAFERALALEPDHDLAGRLRDLALGDLEKSRPCEACRYYYGGSPGGNLLVCAVHPQGPEATVCRDWESKYKVGLTSTREGFQNS